MSKETTEAARHRELLESLVALDDLYEVTQNKEITAWSRRIVADSINQVATDVPMLADLLVSSVLERLRGEEI